MGVWDFITNPFGSKAEAATVPDAEAIKAEMKEVGLDTTGIEIKVEGDKVKIEGDAVSAEVKEKLIVAIGNIAGVSQVEAQPQGEEPVFYVVKTGDNLSKIAKATLGNANRYTEIFEANKPMLKHPDKIYPGQSLRIPAK